MARNSWYHVCDVLARHTFDREIEPQPFTQKTLDEFLQAAGYRKALATSDVASTEVTQAKSSKAALVAVLATTSKAASLAVRRPCKAASVAGHEAASEAFCLEAPPGVWRFSDGDEADAAPAGRS